MKKILFSVLRIFPSSASALEKFLLHFPFLCSLHPAPSLNISATLFLVRIDWKPSVSCLLSRPSTILLLVFPVELFHKDFSQHCRSPWSMARLSMCHQVLFGCFISSRPHSWANGLFSSLHPLTRPISWADHRSEEKHRNDHVDLESLFDFIKGDSKIKIVRRENVSNRKIFAKSLESEIKIGRISVKSSTLIKLFSTDKMTKQSSDGGATEIFHKKTILNFQLTIWKIVSNKTYSGNQFGFFLLLISKVSKKRSSFDPNRINIRFISAEFTRKTSVRRT